MYRENIQGLSLLKFNLLREIPRLKHAVFLRQGGESKGGNADLNLGMYSGGFEKNVKENIEKVKKVLGISTLLFAKQCHGTKIYEAAAAAGPFDEVDGLATKQTNIGLMITHADCQAAIIYDPVAHAVLNIHVGWRGNVENFYGKAVAEMRERYRSRPEDLLVCISPSLGPEHAEFVNYQTEFPKSFWPFREKDNLFNLWEIARMQLLSAGVLPHHIEIASLCTYSNREDFFSYRRDKDTARHGTVVALT